MDLFVPMPRIQVGRAVIARGGADGNAGRGSRHEQFVVGVEPLLVGFRLRATPTDLNCAISYSNAGVCAT